MSDADTNREVDAEAKRLVARVNKGRANLMQLDLPFPGGDVCPARVIVGLDECLDVLDRAANSMEWWNASDDACVAIGWLRMWVDAGAAMLPKGSDG